MNSTHKKEPAVARPVGIVGLGYVGLPLAVDFLDGGVRVLGFERDPERAEAVRSGRSHLAHLADEALAPRASGALLELAEDPSRAGECAGLVFCLPTPLGAGRRPDLSPLERAMESFAPHLVSGQTVVIASTTWPGALRSVLAPRLAASGLQLGTELFAAASPEREDPGRIDPPARRVPRLVGGLDRRSGEQARALLAPACDALVPVESAEVAEAAKLFENLYRAVNIALVGELKQVTAALGLDVWQVLDAAATKPFGFQRFDPGPGAGGHCIPVDPHYWAWVAERAGRPSRFVGPAAQLFQAMPAWVVDQLEAALESRGHTLAGAGVLLLGLAYKADVADLRESPALALLEELESRGALVQYADPHVPHLERAGRPTLLSVELDPDRLAAADAVLLATAHRAFDLGTIAEAARLVVDTRGALRDRMAGDPRYVRA